MELVVQLQRGETPAAALEAGAGGVAVPLPRGLDSRGWADLKAWRADARRRGGKFYLVWDWLLRQGELAGAGDLLAAVAELNPDALMLRDLGLCRMARQQYPQLRLHAAGNWGAHNSPGLRLAAELGFHRVALAGPLSLKDLALMRRQTSLPLEVVLPSGGCSFPGYCLLGECLGVDCGGCPASGLDTSPAAALLALLETLSGLAPLGVESVQLRGGLFPSGSLPLIVELFHQVWQATPVERPGALSAARQVVLALGDRLKDHSPATEDRPPPSPSPESPTSRPHPDSHRQPALDPRRQAVWLEARDYPEAAALAREWAGPLVLQLTAENYSAFLQEHRRWVPRRLIWRLPLVIRESTLAFFQKALEILKQGGYSRFVAGDWGAVALIQTVRGEVLGDQTLGVRNSQALQAARPLGVRKVCLPPGPGPAAWQEFISAAPSGSFWSYLYRIPTLAVHPAAPAASSPLEQFALRKRLRWVPEREVVLLCPKAPEQRENLLSWLKRQGVAPLVVSLPRSGLPRGRIPPFLTAPAGRPRSRP